MHSTIAARFLTLVISCGLAVNGATASASVNETGKFNTVDPAGQFGFSVALRGATVILGDNSVDSGAGFGAGAAYVFDLRTGQQLHRLIPSDSAAQDDFGDAVATNGDVALIGAAGDDHRTGAVYLFNTSTGEQLAKIRPADAAVGDLFGRSIAIQNNLAVIGSWGDSEAGYYAGAAYLFDISDPTNPVQLAKFRGTDLNGGEAFSVSVAMHGTRVVVGATWDNHAGANSGSAYLFDISDPFHPVQLRKLIATDAQPEDFFGNAVALNGNSILIGAQFDDDKGQESGAAYLFDAVTGQQLVKFTGSNTTANEAFGDAIAISGDTAIIASSWDDGAQGAAYIFDISNPVHPIEIQKLIASDRGPVGRYGVGVDIDGNRALVGAPLVQTAYAYAIVPESSTGILLCVGLLTLTLRGSMRFSAT